MKLLFISGVLVSIFAVVVCHRSNRNRNSNSRFCFLVERSKYLSYALKRCEQSLDVCRRSNECVPACGELEVCRTGGSCECGDSSKRDSTGKCVAAGYGGPTCLQSTCTHCSNTGELTLDLTTGDVHGTLTNATVQSMIEPTSGPYVSVDCNYQARLKVIFQPETSTYCTNVLRIDMDFGMNRTKHLFNFAANSTSVGLDDINVSEPHYPEVHGVNAEVISHASDVDCSYNFYANLPNTTQETILLAHRYLRLNNNLDYDNEFCWDCPFGAAVDERDMYLSFNRVILEGSDRNGYGVCLVKLSWVCNI